MTAERSTIVKMIAGKLLYGVVCLFAAVLLVVAGYAHKEVGLTHGTKASRSRTAPPSPAR